MRFWVVILLLVPFDAASQTTRQSFPKDPAKTNQVLLAIRQEALSNANQIIDEMSLVEDFRSRVVIAEKIVKLLSKERPDRCRKMLNAIFEDAMALRSERSKAKSVMPDLDSILMRIIQAAALVDLSLADLYVEQLSNSNDKDSATSSSASVYLRIATDLTRTDPSLAVSIATRALSIKIPPEILVFLATLREHSPVLADRFVITAVQSCQKRGAKDINELMLLYSYVFSPRKVPTISSQGIGVLSIPGYSEVPHDQVVNAALARQYITVVGEIFLDPNRYTQANIQTLGLGIEGDFYVLSIVEPFFTTYLPTLTAKIVRQRNLLASYLNADQRDAAFSAMNRWGSSANDLTVISVGKESTPDDLVRKAESASDPRRKDQLYFRAALMAVRLKKYETALALIDKISSEQSNTAKQFIRFELALHHVQNHQPLEADTLARSDEMLARRAYIFTLIADYLTGEEHKDSSRAFQYLDEVQQLASRLSDPKERLSVLIGAGSVYARVDNVRAAEILRQIVKAANNVPDFFGESGISNVLEIGGFYFDYSIYTNEFTIFDLVKRLALGSYYSTLHDIRLLQNRSLRLNATLALSAAVLSD